MASITSSKDVRKGRGLEPLRIKFRQDGKEKTVYLFVNFHYRYGIRSSDNEEIYRRLLESLRDI